ncbi:MAG: stage III sporulation protein AB [Clostridia bacterium]|nr:stage III sporulation protein AB [Clostridia bacterium]
MNFVAGILIVIACTYAGIGIDGYYKTKIAVLREFLDFIDFALTEITFMKTDVVSLVKKYALKQSRLSNALSAINNPCEAEVGNLALVWLTAGEKALVLDFVKGVAALDHSSQRGYAEEYKAKVSQYLRGAEETRATKGKLVKKLAPLLGLGIMIVIL